MEHRRVKLTDIQIDWLKLVLEDRLMYYIKERNKSFSEDERQYWEEQINLVHGTHTDLAMSQIIKNKEEK